MCKSNQNKSVQMPRYLGISYFMKASEDHCLRLSESLLSDPWYVERDISYVEQRKRDALALLRQSSNTKVVGKSRDSWFLKEIQGADVDLSSVIVSADPWQILKSVSSQTDRFEDVKSNVRGDSEPISTSSNEFTRNLRPYVTKEVPCAAGCGIGSLNESLLDEVILDTGLNKQLQHVREQPGDMQLLANELMSDDSGDCENESTLDHNFLLSRVKCARQKNVQSEISPEEKIALPQPFYFEPFTLPDITQSIEKLEPTATESTDTDAPTVASSEATAKTVSGSFNQARFPMIISQIGDPIGQAALNSANDPPPNPTRMTSSGHIEAEATEPTSELSKCEETDQKVGYPSTDLAEPETGGWIHSVEVGDAGPIDDDRDFSGDNDCRPSNCTPGSESATFTTSDLILEADRQPPRVRDHAATRDLSSHQIELPSISRAIVEIGDETSPLSFGYEADCYTKIETGGMHEQDVTVDGNYASLSIEDSSHQVELPSVNRAIVEVGNEPSPPPFGYAGNFGFREKIGGMYEQFVALDEVDASHSLDDTTSAKVTDEKHRDVSVPPHPATHLSQFYRMAVTATCRPFPEKGSGILHAAASDTGSEILDHRATPVLSVVTKREPPKSATPGGALLSLPSFFDSSGFSLLLSGGLPSGTAKRTLPGQSRAEVPGCCGPAAKVKRIEKGTIVDAVKSIVLQDLPEYRSLKSSEETLRNDAPAGQPQLPAQSPIKIICSPSVTNNWDLVEALENRYKFTLIERNYESVGAGTESKSTYHFADVVVDERTAIVICQLTELRRSDMLQRTRERIVCLRLKFTSCWLLFFQEKETSDQAIETSPISKHLAMLNTIASYFLKNDAEYAVKTMTLSSESQLAECINRIVDLAQRSSQIWTHEQWSQRDWITPEGSYHERFLLTFPCINSFAAQLMLGTLSLKELLTFSLADILKVLPCLPQKVLRLFHRIVHQPSIMHRIASRRKDIQGTIASSQLECTNFQKELASSGRDFLPRLESTATRIKPTLVTRPFLDDDSSEKLHRRSPLALRDDRSCLPSTKEDGLDVSHGGGDRPTDGQCHLWPPEIMESISENCAKPRNLHKNISYRERSPLRRTSQNLPKEQPETNISSEFFKSFPFSPPSVGRNVSDDHHSFPPARMYALSVENAVGDWYPSSAQARYNAGGDRSVAAGSVEELARGQPYYPPSKFPSAPCNQRPLGLIPGHFDDRRSISDSPRYNAGRDHLDGGNVAAGSGEEVSHCQPYHPPLDHPPSRYQTAPCNQLPLGSIPGHLDDGRIIPDPPRSGGYFSGRGNVGNCADQSQSSSSSETAWRGDHRLSADSLYHSPLVVANVNQQAMPAHQGAGHNGGSAISALWSAPSDYFAEPSQSSFCEPSYFYGDNFRSNRPPRQANDTFMRGNPPPDVCYSFPSHPDPRQSDDRCLMGSANDSLPPLNYAGHLPDDRRMPKCKAPLNGWPIRKLEAGSTSAAFERCGSQPADCQTVLAAGDFIRQFDLGSRTRDNSRWPPPQCRSHEEERFEMIPIRSTRQLWESTPGCSRQHPSVEFPAASSSGWMRETRRHEAVSAPNVRRGDRSSYFPAAHGDSCYRDSRMSELSCSNDAKPRLRFVKKPGNNGQTQLAFI